MGSRNNLIWGFFSVLAVTVLALPMAYAQTAPVVKASKIRDFGRVSFEWPRETRLKAASDGNHLRITFEQPARVDPAPILRSLKPYITNVTQSADGKTLTLTTNQAYQIRSFVSGSVNGIDILRLNEKPVAVTVNSSPPSLPVAPAPTAPKQLMKPEPVKKPTPQPKPVPKPEPKPEPKPAPKPEPAPVPVPEPASAIQPAVEPVVPEAPTDVDVASLAAAAETALTERAPAKEDKKTPTNPVDAIQDAPIAAALPPPPMQAELPEVSVPGESVIPSAEAAHDSITLQFPFKQRTAATAFRRGNRDYLYFSQPLEIEITTLNTVEGITSAEAMPLGNGMLVVLETEKAGLIADKPQDSYSWSFILTDEAVPPRRPVKAIPQTEPPLKPHLLLPILELMDGVPYTDPYLGDNLVLVPGYHAGVGVFPPRDFVEFTMLPTAQGIVVKPKTDNLRVARLRDGMKITAPGGLTLSRNLPAVAITDSASVIEGDSVFFPYAQWKTPEGRNFAEMTNELQGQIPFAVSAQKQLLRLRLAQLNLAEERPSEALALINLILRESPPFYMQHKLAALRGVANFLMNRIPEAAADFADENLNDIPETELWRDVISILTTGEGKADYLNYYKNFISKYPSYMAVRLGIVAADMLIQQSQFNNALKIYDTLTPSMLRPSEKGYIDYQMGKIAAATGQKQQAEKIWGELSKRPDNYIRSRAQFALTNYLLREAKIDIPETIRQLEPLRIIWRGDDFELGLLRFIADLYEANHQPKETLRAYREIVQFFPENPENLSILGTMSDMFRALFNGGVADTMSPLEALALYYEFRDLTPLGAEGDKMVRNLADRLVQVDLLDRAAALLEHQVRYRLAGEERSRVGAQLALINLINRKPRQALAVLELTGFGDNPESLQHSRTLLTARALADLGEANRALRLLEDDETPEAGDLRIGMYWDKKDWENVITAGEAILGQRSDPTAAITDSESGVLLKLAIAYVFESQKEQVQYLRDYFLPLMKGNKNEHLFNFVTRDAPVDYRNLARLTSHLNEVENFLGKYRQRMQEEGLSKAIP